MAIRDGRVTTTKENRADSAERVINAEGKIVTPCFTDIHTHSDFTLPLNSKADGKIRQVVTTEVIGNCGFSVAPALPEKVEELRAYLFGSALRFSSGLFTAPACFSEPDELHSLGSVLKRHSAR
ncbi:MAG: hypothetical protein QGH07_16135 [Alphaproteobacteria bacterium]|nr:hypothetical protein [Alphaproteobacteria bacterium]